MSTPKHTPEQVAIAVADALERDHVAIIKTWYERTQEDAELASIPISFEKRTFYLHRLIQDLVIRLRLPVDALPIASATAVEHGKYRATQGYTGPMLVEESRILQVTIFESLKESLSREDSGSVLKSVMTIADEVDSQLKQMLKAYLDAAKKDTSLRVA